MQHKSEFDDKELGRKFIEMGNKFLTYVQENKTVLDFEAVDVFKSPICGTVACHGGHAAVIFGLESYHYSDGAKSIAEFLGFNTWAGYIDWAEENPEFWGNDRGPPMFSDVGYKSFSFTRERECTLIDIGNHYVAVGTRILDNCK